MDRIDKLLMRAKRFVADGIKHIFCWIKYEPDTDKYILSVTLWNGLIGSAENNIYSEHETMQDAEATYNTIVNKYPDAENIRFIISYE